MNDYTKNISSSVWSPGIFINNNKLDTLQTKHRFSKNAVQSKFEHSKYLEQPIEGFRGRVEGKIGEKQLIIQNTRQRPHTSGPSNRRERVI